MKYLSVCSGIEAATVAWHHLGWEPAAFSEIEKFPSAVLAHHYPNVPNLGDMTQYKEWDIEANEIDLLVGGTPCQSFSVAGLRKGLEDPRGNLCLTYLAIADQFKPRWILWENVPGVLSSGGGRDFGSFLGALAQLGYGWAYRILDAQYFGVPQRRRRVFVVGYLGDWRRAVAVLFERHSLSGNPPPSREKRKETSGDVASCLRSGGDGGVSSSRGENLVCFGVDEECNVTADGFGPLLRGGRGGTRQAVCFQQNTRDEVRYIGGDGQLAGALAANAGMKQTNYLYSIMPMNSGKDYKAREAGVTQPIMAGGQTQGNQGGDVVLCMAHGQAGAEICSDEAPIVFEHHMQDSRIKEVDVMPQINAKAGTGGGNLPLVLGFSNVSDGSSARNATEISDPLTR